MLGNSEIKATHGAQTGGAQPSRGSSASLVVGPEGGLTDQFVEFDLAKYLRMLVKHRFVIIGSIIAALVVGLAISLLMTPIYAASTVIQIDREETRVLGSDSDMLQTPTLVQAEEFFQTQYGLLRSRSLAERVVDKMGLANSNAFLDAMEVDFQPAEDARPAEISLARRNRVIKTVQNNLTVSPVRGSRHVKLTFESPDAELAARVVNAFGEAFIQASLDRKFQSTVYVRDFLEGSLAQTKSKLEESERQLVRYAEQQQIISVTDQSTIQGGQQESLASRNLSTLNASLAAARSSRIAAEEKWRSARSTPLLSLPEVLQNPAVQTLSEERARLKAEYEQKLRVYQPDYPEMRQLQARIGELDIEMNAIASSVRTSIQSQYTIALNQERALEQQVNGLKGDVLDLRNRSIQYNILQREVDTGRTLYEGLLQRYKEVGVLGGVTANNISIVDPAVVPTRAAKPDIKLNMAIAALLGLAIGVVAVLMLEALDESLLTPDDIEQKLGLPVLGVAPLLNKEEAPLVALADIRSAFAEAYYSLRTALQFSTQNGAPVSLLVTSSRPAEGKSTTALAIALNFARVGKRVLLVDGDLRNPSLHRTLALANTQGLSNLLSGHDDLRGLVIESGHKGLSFLPCGPLPPSPAELWGSDRLSWFIRKAVGEFDHVIIDGPPVLGFADAPLLASATEGTVFVVESRFTKRSQARGSIRRMMIGKARILGVVLTKFNAKEASYGGYDYAYDYNYGAEKKV
ncbi:MAG: GumC family protein [Brevundimonas sp.]